MTEDEGFLQRWSRRKQSALRDDETQEDPESECSGPEDEAATASESSPAQAPSHEPAAQSTLKVESEPEPPGDEDMPPLESIDEGGSITAFFSPRVSEGLRRAALRRLFRQPKYNVVDMLDDYAEDYSKPAALGSIVTADMRYRAEQAAKRMERIYKESLADKDTTEGEERLADEAQSLADGEPAQQADDSETDAAAVDDKALAGSEETKPSDQETPEDSDRQPG